MTSRWWAYRWVDNNCEYLGFISAYLYFLSQWTVTTTLIENTINKQNKPKKEKQINRVGWGLWEEKDRLRDTETSDINLKRKPEWF